MRKINRNSRYSEKSYKPDHPVPVPIGSPTPLANLSLNSVLLHDWWLFMAQPKGLAVGGFECKGRQGQRVLCSAVIAKRHDATTLETDDGITVAISGFINTSRTLENGFSPEVCSHFLYGFPYDWEEYASSNEEYVSGSNVISFPPPSLDNLAVPAARIRDLLMFSSGGSKKSVYDHMMQKLSTHDSQNAVDSNLGNKHLKACPYSAADVEKKKVKDIENDIVDDTNSRSITTVESQNEEHSRTPSIGVITRSMHRLEHLTTEKQERKEFGRKLRSNAKSDPGKRSLRKVATTGKLRGREIVSNKIVKCRKQKL